MGSLSEAVRLGIYEAQYDMDGNGKLEGEDQRVWVEDLARTYFGDSDLDGEFNTADIVQILQSGGYEDQVANNSTWDTGDWNGDREFGTADIVLALQAGGYEQGPRRNTVVVPEPSSLTIFAWAAILLCHSIRVRKCRDR